MKSLKNLRRQLVSNVSNGLGTLHFVSQSITDGIAEVEARMLQSEFKREGNLETDKSMIKIARVSETKRKQRELKESYQATKKRLAELRKNSVTKFEKAVPFHTESHKEVIVNNA